MIFILEHLIPNGWLLIINVALVSCNKTKLIKQLSMFLISISRALEI